MKQATVISMFLDKDRPAPVTMLELGEHKDSGWTYSFSINCLGKQFNWEVELSQQGRWTNHVMPSQTGPYKTLAEMWLTLTLIPEPNLSPRQGQLSCVERLEIMKTIFYPPYVI